MSSVNLLNPVCDLTVKCRVIVDWCGVMLVAVEVFRSLIYVNVQTSVCPHTQTGERDATWAGMDQRVTPGSQTISCHAAKLPASVSRIRDCRHFTPPASSFKIPRYSTCV